MGACMKKSKALDEVEENVENVVKEKTPPEESKTTTSLSTLNEADDEKIEEIILDEDETNQTEEEKEAEEIKEEEEEEKIEEEKNEEEIEKEVMKETENEETVTEEVTEVQLEATPSFRISEIKYVEKKASIPVVRPTTPHFSSEDLEEEVYKYFLIMPPDMAADILDAYNRQKNELFCFDKRLISVERLVMCRIHILRINKRWNGNKCLQVIITAPTQNHIAKALATMMWRIPAMIKFAVFRDFPQSESTTFSNDFLPFRRNPVYGDMHCLRLGRPVVPMLNV